jgi:hypothetical protein
MHQTGAKGKGWVFGYKESSRDAQLVQIMPAFHRDESQALLFTLGNLAYNTFVERIIALTTKKPGC